MTKKFFFSHDFDASNDLKIQALLKKFGFEGYGKYWKLVELMAQHNGVLEDDHFDIVSFALDFEEQDEFMEFVGFCVNRGLFVLDETGLYSKSLLSRLEYKNELQKKRSEAGKRSAEKRAKAKLESDKVQQSSTSAQQVSTSDEQISTSVQQNSTKEIKCQIQ